MTASELFAVLLLGTALTLSPRAATRPQATGKLGLCQLRDCCPSARVMVPRMAASTMRRVGLTLLLIADAACSGGGKQATTDAGVKSGLTWSVTATYEPDGIPNPDVVLWGAQAQGEFHNPILDAGVRSWSTTGTLTVMRWPSRQPMGNECIATVSPDPQVITLDDVNTRVDLFLGDGDLVYFGMATTRFTNQRTVICPNQADSVSVVDDAVQWLQIPMTPRPANDAVIQGMGDSNGANLTWTLTKSEQ
jgi:hypothetical protein